MSSTTINFIKLMIRNGLEKDDYEYLHRLKYLSNWQKEILIKLKSK